MQRHLLLWRIGLTAATVAVIGTGFFLIPESEGGFRWKKRLRAIQCENPYGSDPCVDNNPLLGGPMGGTWYWSRSPEEEKAVAASLFNRYCIRCHGIDARGVWDIPGIPNFTNTRFQASRSDDQLARAIMQGRGAVMPPFRGVLTLEESWALARYVRSFIPGTEISRPDDNEPAKANPAPAASPPTLDAPNLPAVESAPAPEKAK